jgi:hypothetical protein
VNRHHRDDLTTKRSNVLDDLEATRKGETEGFGVGHPGSVAQLITVRRGLTLALALADQLKRAALTVASDWGSIETGMATHLDEKLDEVCAITWCLGRRL